MNDKYKQALELARQYYGPGQNEFLDTIFPELRESEDEKIRKAIVEFISEYHEESCFGNNQIPRNAILCWLEKQKEQKPIIDTSAFEDTLADVIVSSQGLCNYESCKDVAKKETPYLLSKLNLGQKPAEWSEEDEKLLNYAISLTDDAQIKRFLKSLRPQTNQKWSEEDEKMLKAIINASFQDEPLSIEQIAWLKSLRPH